MTPSPHQDTSTDGVAAVDRALAIVDAVANRSEPITLADLSRATGFYKSTLLRLIVSLEKAALVVRRTDGRYTLGPYAHRLGCAYEATYQITETILPLLQELVDNGSESASFHVYHDVGLRQCLLRVDSHHSTLDRIRVGDLLPLSRGAAGRLISNYVVKRQLEGEDGLLVISMGERDPNCAAVAAPVFGPDGGLHGAISLSGPKERFTPQAIKKMSHLVQDAAQSATRSLGGHWPAAK
ncbi:IclR family transcriptional regulator [Candidimonas nitroreducens]|uniref:IclR family transcriptional regulator n=1 Tax=Candidimonas nitroreducens TaxID=683354 RepID=A0A225M2H7_9BURK|nr:helix-turn-helix domain-containing protein [Candidimonas nitroreducens]OWT53741.1 IclR family transcriptional regulator [Candidimonas nitroreducens]